MRLFIAVDLEPRTRKLLARKINLIKDKIEGNTKWVKKENWHITLKFLGEVRSEQVAKIENIISDVVSGVNRFILLFKEIGAFPSLKHPKVLYIGIKKGEKEMINLYRKLNEELVDIGFEPEDRKFTPHLTIARSKNQSDIRELAEVINDINDPHFINIHMEVKEVKLIESKLHAGGPEYIDIFTNILQ